MAITKTVDSKSLSIRVNVGEDDKGNAKFANRTYSNIKEEALDQDIYTVAEAISKVLADPATGGFFLNTKEMIQG